MDVNQRVFYANEITKILLTLTITPVNCLHVDLTFTEIAFNALIMGFVDFDQIRTILPFKIGNKRKSLRLF